MPLVPLVFFGMYLLFQGVGPKDARKRPASAQPELPLLQRQKVALERYAASHQAGFSTYVELDNGSVLKWTTDSLPAAATVVFQVLRNSQQRVPMATESPVSESGDWQLTYTLYFDAQGRTFACQRATSYFNSGCTGSAAHETITRYYNATFRDVASSYKLVDNNGKKLTKAACAFPYNWPYTPSKTVVSFLKGNKIASGSK